MTTTNDGAPGVHPMVMKAARARCKRYAEHTGQGEPGVWSMFGQEFTEEAFDSLTECGALECFDSAVSLLNIEDAGDEECDDAALLMMHQQNAVESARLGVAKARDVSSDGVVYGSAPE